MHNACQKHNTMFKMSNTIENYYLKVANTVAKIHYALSSSSVNYNSHLTFNEN